MLANAELAYAQAVRDVQACQVSVAELERSSGWRSHAQLAAELCDKWGSAAGGGQAARQGLRRHREQLAIDLVAGQHAQEAAPQARGHQLRPLEA